LGYELVVPAFIAEAIWTQLMEVGAAHGIQPCGLGARDTLRLEMGYPLHGQDLSLDISPVEARVGWAVGWKKDHFDGANVVRKQKSAGVARTLMGIRCVGRGIPRAHMEVVDGDGLPIGEVTSGTFSPSLKVGIALAFLPSTTRLGDCVLVKIRNRIEEFEVVRPPFVNTHVRS
jgi:aminomethyltransferase